MVIVLMFLAILVLACIASAGLIFNAEDVSAARLAGDDMAPSGPPAS